MLQRWDMRLTDRYLLLYIARMQSAASQADIAADLRISPDTVSRCVTRLRAAGYLRVTGGRRVPYRYEINFDALPESERREIEYGLR